MNTALHILREEPATSIMKAVAAPKRDQIRERINQFTSIPSAARAVLIEICTLVALGGKGRCWAANKELASRACCSEMTVSKHIQSLIKSGLVVRTYANGDHAKRDLTPSDELIVAYSTDGGLSGVLNGVKWGDERGLSRVRNGVKRGAYQIEIKEENKEVNDLLSRVAELESALDAASAATQKKEARILELEVELEAINEKWEAGKAKGRKLYADNQATITSLQAQLAEKPATLAIAKPVSAPRKKSAACLMSESPYALVAPFREALSNTDYGHADLAYYHEVIYNWSLSGGNKKMDWIATAKKWMLREMSEGKLRTNTNSQIIQTDHDRQQQATRNQQLGLVAPTRFASLDALREFSV